MERQTLTLVEVAQALGVGKSLIYEAARRGDLPVIRIGTRYVMARTALEKLLGGQVKTVGGGGGRYARFYRNATPAEVAFPIWRGGRAV